MESDNNSKKKSKLGLIFAVIVLIAILGLLCWYFTVGKDYFKKENGDTSVSKKTEEDKVEGEEREEVASEYVITSNSLGKFDLEFLKLENEEENKIYSPISIKYTLCMLNEGTSEKTKKQIERVVGNYTPKKYYNSKNISFANAFFIRDTFKNSVKEKFVSNLLDKYGADVQYDSFSSANNINSWISDKTLDLINNTLDDSDVQELNFALINALAIDMDWEDKFLAHKDAYADYDHEKFNWTAPETIIKGKFEGVNDAISGMQVISSINNYDIVNTLGEEEIRKTVGDAFRTHLEKHPDSYFFSDGEDIESIVSSYLDGYIETLNGHYKDVTTNTEYSFYVDDNVKAFGKDLKEYDDVNLQYVAIMPKSEELSSYIENSNADSINEVISSLKDLKSENFKNGVITAISGYIPKFKFDYELDLMNDLKEMGITDVFDERKANLDEMTTEDDAYIGKAMHKANIEFTQDGIKAAAVTMAGGMGAGEEFNYNYDVPVEQIDLTFDKPYVFFIIDKETGDVWFTGTVYEPLLLDDEPEKDNYILDEMSKFYINEKETIVTY